MCEEEVLNCCSNGDAISLASKTAAAFVYLDSLQSLGTLLLLFCVYQPRMAVTEVEKYAREHKVDVHYIDRDTMDRMSEKRPHQVCMGPQRWCR